MLKLKTTAVATAMIAGLIAPAGLAAAEPVSAPVEAGPIIQGTTGSAAQDLFWSFMEGAFCGVIEVLKGGGNADCTF
ncbi:hypothetical protein [Nocardia arthritidis]|uniref:Uncharacterized protein n=1 Tax=Nocardia arthritidis TaxID=228602 RepID=A0A6G9Y4T0_9NOCA|nr:hypothetical protein [Nocardia arthritidis]QIS08238.1 hypothetical protein F5544_01580 [Nocardia arthritidis]